MLVSKSIWPAVCYAYTSCTPDVGSDHRAVVAEVNVKRRIRRRQSKIKKVGKGWNPTCPDKYAQLTDEHLKQLAADHTENTSIYGRCSAIEKALVQAAGMEEEPELKAMDPYLERRKKLKLLFEQRRQERAVSSSNVSALGKNIQKEIKAFQRARRKDEIQRLLDEGKTLRGIIQQSKVKKKHTIKSMKDRQGSIKTEQKDIADVFADVYEELYSQSLLQGCEVDGNKDEAIPAFAITELELQMCALKKGKARDRSGIVAEMVKNSGKELRPAVLDMFNVILSRDIIQPRSAGELGFNYDPSFIQRR